MPMSTFGYVLEGNRLPEFVLPFNKGANYQGQLSVVASLVDPVPSVSQGLELEILGVNTHFAFGLHLSPIVPGSTVTVPLNFTSVSDATKLVFRLQNIDYPVAVSIVVTVNSDVGP